MSIDDDKFSYEEFNLIREFSKKTLGLYFADNKKVLIYSRLRNRVNELKLNSFSDYYKYLINDKTGKELIHFTNKLTTNYTYFMRENSHFSFLIDRILPELESKGVKTFKIWSAGCSTGEEPYVMAMYLEKYFRGKAVAIDFTATDISEEVLDIAKKGIYPKDKLVSIPDEFLKNHFIKLDDEKYIVSDKIKRMIKFKKVNLISDSFSTFRSAHVIFCRNVIIYFDNKTKETLIEKFYHTNSVGGYFVISRSESLNNISSNYKLITPSIYKKD
ncbi:MAG: CheR family methyltransferase [Lachnospirales bacterium]